MASTVPPPYKEHKKLGVWFQENNQQDLWGISYPSNESAYAGEFEASKLLAEALFRNWLKSKPGQVLDIGAPTSALKDALNSLGCTASVERELQNLSPLDSKYQPKQFDLVTMVHTFQRIAADDAGAFLRAVHSVLKPNGVFYIRMPDHGVAGYERDLKPEITKTATCFWDFHSFLELLHGNPYFTVVETYEVQPGQRDYLLAPASKKPSVCIGMIAKNEARDLPRCLDSLSGVADGICLIDTGSTDDTVKVAREWAEAQGFPEENIHIVQYFEASTQNEAGSWQLWNFGKARNQYVDWIEQAGFDYVLWVDADDEVLDSKKLKNLCMWDQYKIHGIQIQDGGLRWPHHRLWKAGCGIRYTGRCHEYPSFGVKDFVHKDIAIRHDSAPGAGESSNARNLRILQKEFEEEPTPRCAFYLGNTYKDAGKWKEAIPPYQKRLDYGSGYADEYYFALLYKGRCERLAKLFDDAYKTLWRGVTERPDWAEFWMELAYTEYERGNFQRAAGFSLMAKDRPVVPTLLFREKDKYTDQPERLSSWSFELMGMKAAAYEMGVEAKKKIGAQDQSWEDRLSRLHKEINTERAKTLHVNRPGAAGDILITLQALELYKKQNPAENIVYYCAKPFMGLPKLSSAVNSVEPTENFNLVKEDSFNKKKNLTGYPRHEGYPHSPMKRHLIQYFSEELGIKMDQLTYGFSPRWQ